MLKGSMILTPNPHPRAERALRSFALPGADVVEDRCADACCGAAVEIAVHGWDISQATGQRRPVPCSLAFELLVVSQELVPDGNRDSIFAAPLPVTGPAGPSERLLAYLGRRAGC